MSNTNRTNESLADSTDITTESIQAAGDVIIDEVILFTSAGEIDLRNFLLEFSLYEDMFSNAMSATAIITDAAGIISKVPLRGGEFLNITIRTPTFPATPEFSIKRTFIVTGLLDRILDKDRQQIYVLRLVSPEAVSDNLQPLSKSYSGTTDKIVGDIFKEYLLAPRYTGDAGTSALYIFGAPHSSSLTFVVPFWTPFKAINWVCARTVSGRGVAPNALFYESNKNFYYGTVEDIISQQRNAGIVFGEYFYGDNSIRDRSSGNFNYVSSDLGTGYKVIEAINIPRQFDILDGQDLGYYSGTMLTHDIVTKEYYDVIWDYGDSFTAYRHLESYTTDGGGTREDLSGAYPQFSKSTPKHPHTYRTVRTKHHKIFNDYTDSKIENWSLQRNSMLYEMSNLRIHIDVPGRTDIEVGVLVYLNFPIGTNKETDVASNFDERMSGVYLVSAIHHTISIIGKHKMVLELIKDSFKKSVD